MKLSMHVVVWTSVLTLFVGLVLGVAIGRSRSPFLQSDSASQSPAIESITVRELQALIDKGTPFTLIDVRETEEYNASHILNAQSIPLGSLWAKQSEIPREQLVVIYCSNGVRGKIAARELLKLGLTNIKHLEGGIAAWQNQ